MLQTDPVVEIPRSKLRKRLDAGRTYLAGYIILGVARLSTDGFFDRRSL